MISRPLSCLSSPIPITFFKLAPKRIRTVSSGSKGPPQKRRAIGAAGIGDETARLIAAHHQSEHAGQGRSYLTTRADPTVSQVRSLTEVCLRVSAIGLLEKVKMPSRNPGAGSSSSLIGWDKDRENDNREEMGELRDYVKGLPSNIANRLLELVLQESVQELGDTLANDNSISIIALGTLFLHPNTSKLDLSFLSAPTQLLSKIPQCTSLAELDLSSHTTISDASLAKILEHLPTLQKINLRGCTKVSDKSVIALSKATEERLRSVNLSLCAVGVKGLVAIFARCKSLEVLKLANVQGLSEKAVAKLVDDSTTASFGWRHVPLPNLQTLKLRSTDLTDASLGRLLALCATSLVRLDISYTQVKSLDFLSRALHQTKEWRFEKLVASGLPLSPQALQAFFEPLSRRPEEERQKFHTLKLGAIPSTSIKCPGLTDAVLEKILPYWETLAGLKNISLYKNWELGKRKQPMTRFMEVVGRKCTMLDLTFSLQDHHLEGLLPPLADTDEDEDVENLPPPALEILILDSSRISDNAAPMISECKSLRALHLQETRISTAFLVQVLKACPRLSTLNLTSCRGVPVAQRRTFFEAWKRGEVEAEEGLPQSLR